MADGVRLMENTVGEPYLYGLLKANSEMGPGSMSQ